MPPKPQSSNFRSLLKLLFFLILLALPVLFWVNRFEIYDWWRLRGYTPPAEIQALATNTTMNSATTNVFYANHPSIESSEQFVNNCTQAEHTIVLGCYVNGRGIYLYNVTDPRLDGIKEVTAAHELLHAEYDRLSSADKKKVDAMTAEAFSKVTDQRIRDTVEQYRKADPSVVPNELHSILGSEVRNLTPELEAHYSKYFANRSKIVDYSDKYESEFNSRQNQVKTYDQQLSAMKTQIDQNQAKLSQQESELQSERAQLNQLLANKNYSEYNAGVNSFNAKVASYNSLAKSTTALIAEYNDIVKKRNELALEVNDLAKAIDSRPKNISTQ